MHLIFFGRLSRLHPLHELCRFTFDNKMNCKFFARSCVALAARFASFLLIISGEAGQTGERMRLAFKLLRAILLATNFVC